MRSDLTGPAGLQFITFLTNGPEVASISSVFCPGTYKSSITLPCILLSKQGTVCLTRLDIQHLTRVAAQVLLTQWHHQLYSHRLVMVKGIAVLKAFLQQAFKLLLGVVKS